MARTVDLVVTTTGFDIACDACWTARTYVPAGRLQSFCAAHHLPVLLAVHITANGRPQTWECKRPRPLTR